MTDLASIAGDLYALDLDAFTAERNARATAARADATTADSPDLAASIAALPKPSAAAWLVNQLVRAEPETLSAALALGPALRSAQSSLDREALRELGRQRREALGDVVDAARRVGADRGRPVSSAIADDVEQTVLAAIADADAEIAVRSGRLVRTLITIGGEPVDLSGAVAAPGEELSVRGAAARPRASRPPEPAGPGPVEKARAEKSAAELSATAARNELTLADEELAAAADRHEQLVGERDDALAEYERLEKEVGAAERQRREAIRERDRAHRRVEGAERVLARADERLAQLE